MPRQNDEHEYSFDPQNEKSATHWHTSDTPAQKKTQPLNNQEVSKKEDPTLIQRKQEAIALYPNLCKNTLIGIAEVEVYQRICQEAANGTGVDLQKLTIVPNSRKADADNAEAELVGDEMHFASGMFSGVAPKTVELFCHELQHYIDQQKGQVAAPTNLGFNQDPTLEKKAEKAENGTFTNSPEGTNAIQNEEVAQFKPKKDTVLGEHKAKKAPYYLYIVGNDAIILNKTTKEAWYKEIANNQTYGISDFETNRATWTAFSAEDYAACTLTPPASLYSFGTPDPNSPQIQNSLPTNSVNATQPSINPATYKQDQAAVKNQPPAPPQNNWLGKFLKVLGEVVVEVGTQMVKEALFITFVEDVTAFVDALKAKDWAKAYQAGLGIASKMPFPLIKGAAAALAVFEEAKEGLKTLQSGDTEAIAKLLLEKGVENRLEGLGDALKNATFPSPPIQTTPPQSIYVPPTPNTPINQVQPPVNQENTPVQTPANQQNTPLKVPNAPIVQQQKTPHNPPPTNTPQNKSSEFDALQAKFVKNGNALPPEQLDSYQKGLAQRGLELQANGTSAQRNNVANNTQNGVQWQVKNAAHILGLKNLETQVKNLDDTQKSRFLKIFADANQHKELLNTFNTRPDLFKTWANGDFDTPALKAASLKKEFLEELNFFNADKQAQTHIFKGEYTIKQIPNTQANPPLDAETAQAIANNQKFSVDNPPNMVPSNLSNISPSGIHHPENIRMPNSSMPPKTGDIRIKEYKTPLLDNEPYQAVFEMFSEEKFQIDKNNNSLLNDPNKKNSIGWQPKKSWCFPPNWSQQKVMAETVFALQGTLTPKVYADPNEPGLTDATIRDKRQKAINAANTSAVSVYEGVSSTGLVIEFQIPKSLSPASARLQDLTSFYPKGRS